MARRENAQQRLSFGLTYLMRRRAAKAAQRMGDVSRRSGRVSQARRRRVSIRPSGRGGTEKRNVLGAGVQADQENSARTRCDVRRFGAQAATAGRSTGGGLRDGGVPERARNPVASSGGRWREAADTGTARFIAAATAGIGGSVRGIRTNRYESLCLEPGGKPAATETAKIAAAALVRRHPAIVV